MRRKINFFIICLIVMFLFPLAVYSDTLSVLPFEDAIGEYGKGTGKVAADIVTAELAKSKVFVLVEREDIRKIVEEQGFSLTGAVDPKTSAKVGKLLGVKYLMLGKVTQVEKLSGIDPRYKKCCILGGCLTFGCLGAIAAAIFPSKGYRVGLSIRVVDTESGSIVFTDSEIEEDDTIHEAIKECVESIIKQLRKKFRKDS